MAPTPRASLIGRFQKNITTIAIAARNIAGPAVNHSSGGTGSLYTNQIVVPTASGYNTSRHMSRQVRYEPASDGRKPNATTSANGYPTTVSYSTGASSTLKTPPSTPPRDIQR